MRQTGVQRQGGEAAAMGGDAALIQSAQVFQQGAGFGQGSGGGRGEKGQIGPAPQGEFQGKARKVGGFNLGGGVGGKGALFSLSPQPVAGACRHAARTATALFRLGLGDAFGHQA